MMKPITILVAATWLTLAAGHVAQAQPKPGIPLRVEIAISTFQGEKKVSSLPYMLSVNAVEPPFNSRPSQVRMGAEIPVPAPKGDVKPTPDGKPGAAAPAAGSMMYKALGTNIDCSANSLGDGRFELNIAVEDSSIVRDQTSKAPARAGDLPILRSFRLANQVILRDGQSTQFTAATDRISGEVIKVEVTLTVIK